MHCPIRLFPRAATIIVHSYLHSLHSKSLFLTFPSLKALLGDKMPNLRYGEILESDGTTPSFPSEVEDECVLGLRAA